MVSISYGEGTKQKVINSIRATASLILLGVWISIIKLAIIFGKNNDYFMLVYQ